MPSEDYGSVSRGALKIKGTQGSKVEKHKKKKKKTTATEENKTKLEDDKPDESEPSVSIEKQQQREFLDTALADEDEKDEQEGEPGSAMTDAERQSYERRYKMVWGDYFDSRKGCHC